MCELNHVDQVLRLQQGFHYSDVAYLLNEFGWRFEVNRGAIELNITDGCVRAGCDYLPKGPVLRSLLDWLPLEQFILLFAD